MCTGIIWVFVFLLIRNGFQGGLCTCNAVFSYVAPPEGREDESCDDTDAEGEFLSRPHDEADIITIPGSDDEDEIGPAH